MTRKDYIKFADLLRYVREAKEAGQEITDDWVILAVANIFGEDNPRFDRDRFFNAVYNKGKEKRP